MRSSFGRLAQEIRHRIGMTQTEFASAIGESVSRVSQLEHQRTNINDRIIGSYIKVLNLGGDEICKLREHAEYSNRRLSAKNKDFTHDSLHALLAQYGGQLTADTVEAIRRLILRDLDPETALNVATLEFSNTRSASKLKTNGAGKRTAQRPSLMPARFVELCLLAEEHRNRFMSPHSRWMDVERLLEAEVATNARFDFDIVEALPSYAQGAFACITGTREGHTILLEADGYKQAVLGSCFRRHVIGHEYAHHVLHSKLLQSDAESYLPVQEWARIKEVDDDTATKISQVVDTIEEVEAEFFATMLLVPWTEFLKGTEPRYLAKDFGEQKDQIKKYAPYFKNQAILNGFRETLWERGDRSHPIFAKV